MDFLMRFAMCALLPRAAGFPGTRETGVAEWVARFRREATMPIYLGVLVGSVLFMILPLLTIGVPLPAVLLPRALLERHARKVTSFPVYPIRQSIFLVKMAAGLCWGAHPDVREQLHLPPYSGDPGTFRSA